MPAAIFIVRSTVADPAKRTAFDKWYQDELLPDAVKSFRVKKAWRFWSLSNPAIHQATYRFDDEAALERAMKEEVPRLIDKFVRDWPDVPRVRETFVLAQEFGAELSHS
jgi:hypothetical protein